MDDASTPVKFLLPWAASAGGAYINAIPVASQIGIANGRASLTDGFPPNCVVRIDAGGAGPFMGDTNGLLFQITSGLIWHQAGGPVYHDAAFSTAHGGYPKQTILASDSVNGNFWLNLVDNNTTDPDTGGANWLGLSLIPSTILAGANALSNVVSFTNSARVDMVGSAGNAYKVTAWNGASGLGPYVKQRAGSDLMVWLTSPTFTPTTPGSGCSIAEIIVGAQTKQVVCANNTATDSRGSTVINSVFTGLGAGSLAISLDYTLFSGTGWETVFCPTSSDSSYFPATTLANLIIGEVGG